MDELLARCEDIIDNLFHLEPNRWAYGNQTEEYRMYKDALAEYEAGLKKCPITMAVALDNFLKERE